jgi:hypothetical protein
VVAAVASSVSWVLGPAGAASRLDLVVAAVVAVVCGDGTVIFRGHWIPLAVPVRGRRTTKVATTTTTTVRPVVDE